MSIKQIITAALLIAANSSIASNLQWLNSAAVRTYSDVELDRMYANAINLLDNGDTGDSADWQGEFSYNRGSATVLRTLTSKPYCRLLNITNQAQYYSGNHTYKFCQKIDNSWKLIGIIE